MKQNQIRIRKQHLHQTLTSNTRVHTSSAVKEPYVKNNNNKTIPLFKAYFKQERRLFAVMPITLLILYRNLPQFSQVKLNLNFLSCSVQILLVFINYRKQASLHHTLPRHRARGLSTVCGAASNFVCFIK